MNEVDLARLRRLVTDYSGLDTLAQPDRTLEQAVAQRLAKNRLESLAAYWPLIEPDAGTGEINHLVQLLTNKETFFLREMHHFDLLRKRIVPELLAAGQRRLRLWSAGCATGEEAYSLAITLLEALGRPPAVEVQVVATDIDRQALEIARRGCYGPRSLRLVSDDLRRRYFYTQGRQSCVVPEVARLVTFSFHNLAEDCGPADQAASAAAISGDMDVIFCRNVTIYFEAEARERLNARLAASLRDGGYLFVASAETMSHNQGRLKIVSWENTFVFRKSAAPPAVPTFTSPVISVSTPSVIPAEAEIQTSTNDVTPVEAGIQTSTNDVIPAETGIQAARQAFRDHDFEMALRELGRLPAGIKTHADARCLQAAILLQQMRLDEAEALCGEVLKGDPWQADAHLLLGLIYRQRDQAEASLKALKQAIYLQPDHRDAHFFLAESYRALGLWDQARREYENTLNTLWLGRAPQGSPVFYLSGLEDEMLRQACEANLKKLRPGRSQGFDRGRSRGLGRRGGKRA